MNSHLASFLFVLMFTFGSLWFFATLERQEAEKARIEQESRPYAVLAKM